ncbi:hypothetical protein HK104_002516 [Borealophlyctis nickersoniae]|nr:hypothetical protein HK104_002516 [Borealophlyctis nickersoniae]
MARDDDSADQSQTEIALSIEETNKLRISLGLKPLTEGKGTEKEKAAEDNYARHKEKLAKEAEKKALVDTIEKEKNKAAKNKKLTGATLGDASDEEDTTGDALAWVQHLREKEEEKKRLRAKKKREALAKKKAKELEEMDQAAGGYNAAGLRVEHQLEDVLGGGETILTLKDATIEANEAEGDVLQSVALAEAEKNRKNEENRKKKTAYNAYDDDEFLTPGTRRNILSHYDEEIEGPKRVGFTLNQAGAVDMSEEERRQKVSQDLKANAVTLAYHKQQEIKDYYTQEEMVAFKKPKKKKKSRKERARLDLDALEAEEGINGDHGSRRRRGGQEEGGEEEGTEMEVDKEEGAVEKEKDYSLSNINANIEDVNFVDDDDLQTALARARRLAYQKNATSDVEQIAQAARETKDVETVVEEGGLVLSATTEFVRNLPTASSIRPPEVRPAPKAVRRPLVEPDEEENKAEQPMEVDEEEPDRGGWEDDASEKAESEFSKDTKMTNAEDQDEGEILPAPIEEEPLVSGGLGATIALLSQKGFLEKANREQLEKERKQIEKRKWLEEQRLRDLMREKEKERRKQLEREQRQAQQRGGGGGMNMRDREWEREEETRWAERQRAREEEERFRNYIPDVNLEYHDEYGRKLTAKEAFRQLSHKFHGKHSGKMKTEKRLKKIEEELTLASMSSVDTPLGTAGALLERTKAVGSAHVVLSVGNRGALPADVSLMEARSASSIPAGNNKAPPLSKQTKAAAAASAATITVTDATRSVNVHNREKVAFGLGDAGGGKGKRKAEGGAVGSRAKRLREDE